MFPRRKWITALVGGALLAVAGLGALFAYSGFYGINVVLRHGGSIWLNVTPDDPRLSPSMRLALGASPPHVEAGSFEWKTVADGLETAELPVLADGRELDRIFLSRVDPRKFRFTVRNAPAGDMELSDWMAKLGAALVINGSYFSMHGTPDTPFKSEGTMLGPKDYTATHGAFAATPDTGEVVDLQGKDWHGIFTSAENALVSYPLLIRASAPVEIATSRWLANRSFVGQDCEGRIVFGTTADAFFTLHDLAEFLARARLDLTTVLNLDGGPVACQGVSTPSYKRDICGQWELTDDHGQLKLLSWVIGRRRAALPVILAVLTK